eukprot:TRINITY_DN96681_c0_g1_i1.p1 TRINITY_DN96681_c0_g1~~TRINITY_DN96681_c0_g1_i1.p1  ORF type:complete len:256 (+),score=42.62 TRINITY_DN96681_c0_g1_i1:23-790(+)
MWQCCQCKEDEVKEVTGEYHDGGEVVDLGSMYADASLKEMTVSTPPKVVAPVQSLVVPPKPSAAGPENILIRVDMSSGDPLGVTLDMNDPLNLLVVSIDDGLLKTQLAAAGRSSEVKPGFRIAKVNGDSGKAEEIIKALVQAHTELEIEFEPFVKRELVIEKGNKKLGVALAVGSNSLWLTVTKVQEEGAIPEINVSLTDAEQVKVHDKIAMVDGLEAPAKDMVLWIGERPGFTLTMYSWMTLRDQTWVAPVLDS